MKAATLLSLLSVTGLVAAAPAGNGPAGGIINRDLPVDLPTKGLPIVGELAGGNKGSEKPGNKVTAREDPTGSTPDGKGNGAGGDLTGLPFELPYGLEGGNGGLGLRRRGNPLSGVPVVGGLLNGAGAGTGAKGGADSGTPKRRDGLPVVGDVAGGLLGGAKGGADSGTPKRRDGPLDGDTGADGAGAAGAAGAADGADGANGAGAVDAGAADGANGAGAADAGAADAADAAGAAGQ
ncbi:hypothetical protein BDV33DRAFT_40143 [Aspergillus novoparasiticus]|uniref:Uncharacterized protein n=1 Tax=Aspergillus novoparasiticus TaxID=986946 RepID=A0A5N6F2D4_9EURO|nr:hypothetical protein BDV33DRAFT_40143 [Aspergillus novoparasiticus]